MDRYITIVSTVLVTAVTYLGFEYRSVHDGDGRGFTVKPTAKYVDECLNIVQLQHAKAVTTPLTEQKSLNLHDETTACDQVQHSLFRAVVGKHAVHYWSETRSDVCDKTLKHITGYSDADWAGDPVTRKSTSCTLCYVDQFLLTSECRGQGTVALSSGESENVCSSCTVS